MTNDTTTLNGALTELGETMADNLVTMGVTDATASDGLTTLANKILEIPVTPITQSLTLTSDKNILSYYDGDTCTLTATLSGGDVSGKTVEFFNGSTSLGTALTNANGVATKTYQSQGIGDISITASVGSISSETYEVEDCWGVITDSVAMWDYNSGVSTSFENGFVKVSNSGTEKWIGIASHSFDLPFSFKSTIKWNGSSDLRFSFLVSPTNSQNSSSSRSWVSSGNLVHNITDTDEHELEIQVRDGNFYIYVDGTVDTTVRCNSMTNHYVFMYAMNGRTYLFKNWRIKPL